MAASRTVTNESARDETRLPLSQRATQWLIRFVGLAAIVLAAYLAITMLRNEFVLETNGIATEAVVDTVHDGGPIVNLQVHFELPNGQSESAHVISMAPTPWARTFELVAGDTGPIEYDSTNPSIARLYGDHTNRTVGGAALIVLIACTIWGATWIRSRRPRTAARSAGSEAGESEGQPAGAMRRGVGATIVINALSLCLVLWGVASEQSGHIGSAVGLYLLGGFFPAATAAVAVLVLSTRLRRGRSLS